MSCIKMWKFVILVLLIATWTTASIVSSELDDGSFIHDSSALSNDATEITSAESELSDPGTKTTSAPSTSSTTTTTPMTTTSTTTVAPNPSLPVYYNISNNGAYCIMVDGDFSLNITYNAHNKTTLQALIVVPKPGIDDAKVDGNCTGPHDQWISIAWGDNIPKNSITFQFNKTEDGLHWNVTSVNTTIAFSNALFPNATNPETVIQSSFKYMLNPHNVPLNQSYNCHTPLFGKNGTTDFGNKTYSEPVQFQAKQVQIQAFNQRKKNRDFVKPVYCRADKATDVLPTVVGCILAATVLFVICAYIFGPERHDSGYEPI